MENKQTAFVATSNSMFRASMMNNHKHYQYGGNFGTIGTMLIIIVPLIIWFIIKDKDNGK